MSWPLRVVSMWMPLRERRNHSSWSARQTSCPRAVPLTYGAVESERMLAAPIRHSIEGGGKRLRGLLTVASYQAAGGRGDSSSLAAALEIVHAYSLVHDDLPCMDDDVMRRGRP